MLARIRKALVAGIGASLAAYLTASANGPMTAQIWGGVAGSAVAVGLTTWFIPNDPPKPPTPRLPGAPGTA